MGGGVWVGWWLGRSARLPVVWRIHETSRKVLLASSCRETDDCAQGMLPACRAPLTAVPALAIRPAAAAARRSTPGWPRRTVSRATLCTLCWTCPCCWARCGCGTTPRRPPGGCSSWRCTWMRAWCGRWGGRGPHQCGLEPVWVENMSGRCLGTWVCRRLLASPANEHSMAAPLPAEPRCRACCSVPPRSWRPVRTLRRHFASARRPWQRPAQTRDDAPPPQRTADWGAQHLLAPGPCPAPLLAWRA